MNIKTLRQYHQQGDTYTPEWSYKQNAWLIQVNQQGRGSTFPITTARGQVKPYVSMDSCIKEIEGITGQKVVSVRFELETEETEECGNNDAS